MTTPRALSTRWALFATKSSSLLLPATINVQLHHLFSTSSPPPINKGPLHGYKVLDLGQVVAGNFAGALLAYFGAEVWKVEPPNRGDALRHLRDLDSSGTSLWWRSYGRNRRCITIDLHKEEGRDIIKKLSTKVDVLVENFRPGVMEKWGLGPKDLSPNLIYTRISGYGQTGPFASYPGYASVCEAFGGFRFINGYPDRAPVRPNISLGDSLAGLHAAFGAVMALVYRDGRNGVGRGQVVDASISESMFNMLEGCLTEFAASGAIRPPSGSTLTGVVPSGCWKASDGVYVIIGGNGNSVYDRLMKAIDKPDMTTENPKYATDSKRCEAEEEICHQIEQWVAQHSSDHVMKVLNEARVPAGPILSIADIATHPQYMARGMIEKVGSRVSEGTVRGDVEGSSSTSSSSGRVAEERDDVYTLPAMVPVLSESPGRTMYAGPELGQHTNEILKDVLGMNDMEIEGLRQCGAI